MAFDAHSEATEQTSTNNSVTDFDSVATSDEPEDISQITEQGVTTGKTGDLTREELTEASLRLRAVTERTYNSLFKMNHRRYLVPHLDTWTNTPTDYKAATYVINNLNNYALSRATEDSLVRKQTEGLSTLLDGLKEDKPRIL